MGAKTRALSVVLLLLYMTAILNPAVVMIAHLAHHVMTATLHQHSDSYHSHHQDPHNIHHSDDLVDQDHLQPHAHSHSDILDQAIRNINTEQKENNNTKITIPVIRIFAHLRNIKECVINISLITPQIIKNLSRQIKDQIQTEPLLPPPQNLPA